MLDLLSLHGNGYLYIVKAIENAKVGANRETVWHLAADYTEVASTINISCIINIFITDNGKPPTLVTSMIDYNMPITMAYMKHMKLQLLNSQQDEVKIKYSKSIHSSLQIVLFHGVIPQNLMD